ncbi:MAG: helix-turn-helix transcriptional regulator [Caulobacteraceae bacterium]
MTAERLLAWPQVRPMCGDMGRTTAWRLINRGDFPQPIKVSANRVAWRESDILAWQASRTPQRAEG